MKIEIKVPAMGESISEVTIGSILVSSEKFVKADEEILELETDKVNQLLYAPQAGVLHLTVHSGDHVKIGQVIGTIDVDAKVKEPLLSPSPNLSSSAELKPEKTSPVSFPQHEKATEPSQQISIRKTKESFLADLQQEPKPEAPNEVKKVDRSLPAQKEKRETRQKMSKIRKVIASRLIEAQQTTAMLTTFNEVDMFNINLLREKYKESFNKKYGTKLGFMSFFVKASVAALKALPGLNSYIDGDEIVHREYYDIGIAVGTEKGLIVPVIRNCDQLSFAEIELAIEAAAKKAKEGQLVVEDLQGGGFTITNGGVYGSLLSTPILNPPQSGILGMHKIMKRPVVINDQIVIRPMMYVALSYDHRIVDGKEAVSFLVYLKDILEDPARLLLAI